jgi:hypothetical protein
VAVSAVQRMGVQVHALLLFGGLRAPLKPISRAFPPCPLPLAMRPPGTAMGPLPFGPAIAPLDAWCRRSREARRETWGALGVKEGGGLSWWAKAPCGRCGGGGCWWWWGASGRSEFGWLVGANVVMASARWYRGTRAVQGRRSGGSERGAGIRGQRLFDITCSIAAAAAETARLRSEWPSHSTRATSLTAGNSSIRRIAWPRRQQTRVHGAARDEREVQGDGTSCNSKRQPCMICCLAPRAAAPA